MREQEGDETTNGAREGEEPAYHARRPMNAFLIFCKRHRAVVRDKYPNLENRSITKILGEWWANLEEDEKSSYTGLAKQYKDAFFNANPDFKWYKLPAPPLRTLTQRTSSDVLCETQTSVRAESPELRTNNNSTKFDFNKRRPNSFEGPQSGFTPGKLADEANMGGLSSLLTVDKPEPIQYENIYARIPYKSELSPPRDSIQELQNALSETTRIFEDFDDKPKYNEYGNDKNFTNQQIIEQVVDRGIKEEKGDWSESDKNSRSGRSCKGKRYQEFMAVGGLLTNKRARQDWDYQGMYDDENSDEAPQKRMRSESPGRPDSTEPEDIKPFRPADFDLEAKIAALPSLSLEKFQQRKRESKKKKRNSFSIRPPAQSSQKEKECREQVSGSQKRKPRKISITRLEVNSMVNRTGEERVARSAPDMMIATEAPRLVQPGTLDLCGLATLAEVAANTCKMDETNYNNASITY